MSDYRISKKPPQPYTTIQLHPDVAEKFRRVYYLHRAHEPALTQSKFIERLVDNYRGIDQDPADPELTI